MTTSRRRLFMLFALVLGAALMIWWMARPEAPRELVASESTSGETPPTDLSWLSLDLRWLLYRTTQVRFLVIDEQGLPLEGVRLSMPEHVGGVTDADGELVLDEVPQGYGSYDLTVDGPWLVVDGSTEGGIEGAFQNRLVILRPSCPGVVRLVDEEGAPLAGAQVWWVEGVVSDVRSAQSHQPQRTDGTGEALLPDLPCGLVPFHVEYEACGGIPYFTAEVVAGEPTILTLPRIFQGVLAVVDGDEVPVDAKVDALNSLSVERLGVGRFSVRARRPWNPVEVSAEAYPKQRVRMTLDGGEHVFRIIPGHEVEVTLLCDERCAEDLSCGYFGTNECRKAGANHFLCSCPSVETNLWSRSYGMAVGAVQAEEEAVIVDIRENVSVTGRWTGSLPCDVRAEPSNHGPWTCRSDGTFFVDYLSPRRTTITVRHGLEEQASTSVDLKAGESLDLGEIGPAGKIVDGMIDADFSLDGALLRSTPNSRTELCPDGAFLLYALPAESGEITLSLFSPLYGGFHETFPAPVQDSLPTWRISAREAVDTTPLDELLDAESDDTGEASGPETDTGRANDADGGWPETGAP